MRQTPIDIPTEHERGLDEYLFFPFLAFPLKLLSFGLLFVKIKLFLLVLLHSLKRLIKVMLLFGLVFLMATMYDAHYASRLLYETSGYGSALDCLTDLDFRGIQYIPSETFGPVANVEITRFCRRSTRKTSENLLSIKNKTIVQVQPFTFEQLREMNISTSQLLEWYAPLDTIEKYALGETGLFFNCSNNDKLWFGVQCEYTFNSADYFPELVRKRQQEKKSIPNDILSITNGTCYTMDHTDCKGILCLDWREICDGKHLTINLVDQ